MIREAIYQLAPFLGFPRTFNAVAAINEVFQARGIELPLSAQGTVSDADRYPKGLAEQAPPVWRRDQGQPGRPAGTLQRGTTQVSDRVLLW